MIAVPRRLGSAFALTALAAAACTDDARRLSVPTGPNATAVKFWDAGATTRWNDRANDLLELRPPGNGQAGATRILAYLSVAQYRAVRAAEAQKAKSVHPSASAAVGGASVAVLSAFFPLDVATIEAQLDADLAGAQWPGARNEDPAAGEAIGRSVGAGVVALANTDNYLATDPGDPPVGPGFWVSAPVPIVRSLHGTRPFFLTSADQLRPPPPPAFGSPEFLAALAEVRAISDTRTAEQLAIAQLWAGEVSILRMNRISVELIRRHRRTERQAAEILARGNAASFDAQIACWDAKFAHWFIRPVQADPGITVPIPMPNHPSYPSGHSCVTSGIMTVLADAFPSEKARMEAIIGEAGLSRVYGGIHYRFDIIAGQDIGRAAAALALAGTLD